MDGLSKLILDENIPLEYTHVDSIADRYVP